MAILLIIIVRLQIRGIMMKSTARVSNLRTQVRIGLFSAIKFDFRRQRSLFFLDMGNPPLKNDLADYDTVINDVTGRAYVIHENLSTFFHHQSVRVSVAGRFYRSDNYRNLSTECRLKSIN